MSERQVDLNGAAFRVDRERVLARMARASRRDRRLGLGYVALFAAASALAVIFGERLRQHVAGSSSNMSLEVVVSEGSATQILGPVRSDMSPKERTYIAATGELETGKDSNARVTTADGLQIELQSQSRVSLGELLLSTNQVKLLNGRVRCTIPHRAASKPFQVVTPDVTIIDLGTVFTVSVEGPDLATRISVEEGEVLVRHSSGQTRVFAPNSWSSAPTVAEPAASATATELGARMSNAPLAPQPKDMRPAPRAAHDDDAPGGTLALEAQLLRQGLAAERQGRAADAISVLTQLLTKYPHSPLIPDARAALRRIESSAQQ